LEQLSQSKIEVIICTFIMDCDSVSDAQLRLIRAAERCQWTKRYIPSEYNVEYDVGDNILPYPEKRYHLIARCELEKTRSLEYSYIYPGMLMDYFGMPRVESSLRPLCFFIDPVHRLAVLPDNGEAKMSMAHTTDLARMIPLILELNQWPRVMKAAVSTISLNQLVKLVEKSLGQGFQVKYQPVEKLLKHEAVDLPSNVEFARDWPDRFPGGLTQLRGLIADLEAGVALGAFDLDQPSGGLDLVERFRARLTGLKSIEDLVDLAWGRVTVAS